jgi:predicted permease
VVVLTLALGIGANTAVFSFLDRALLRTLPVKKPHELVMVKYRTEKGDTDDCFVYPFYLDLREQSKEMFSGLIAYWSRRVDLSNGDSTRKVWGVAVSSDYFSVLGVKPAVGRGFLAEDDQAPGGHPVAIISHGLWQRQFDGDPGVLGKTIRLDDYPLTIVGVAPPEFTGTCVGKGPSVYVPLKMWAHIKDISLEKWFYDWLYLIGRPKPGVSRQQAQAVLRVAAERIHAIQPINTPTEILVADGSRGTSAGESLWRPFALLQVVTALVLLVACANVANMLLARGMTRQKEIAIRRAMGASRSGIVRQLLTESALLAILSGACGVLLAHWLSIALRSALTEASKLNTPVGTDGRILVFALLASLGSVLVFGLVPALRASRPDPMAVIKDDAGAVTVLGRRRNLRSFLVIVQIAVSVVVLAFGALCVRSLLKQRFTDPGFDPARVLGVSVNFERAGAKGLDPQQFFADLKERVATYPGVQTVSLAAIVPLSPQGQNKTGATLIEGFQILTDRGSISWEFLMIGPGYFQTVGVPIVRGRDFSARDRSDTAKVMIVNELMAQRYWPGQNPIGKRVTLLNGDVREVVGVVKAVQLQWIQDEPVPQSFWPLTQPMGTKSRALRAAWRVKPVLLVRTTGNPKAVSSLVRSELDSAGLSPALYDVRTSAEHAWDLLIEQRIFAGILNIVGSVGLLFVATGIFSVMAFEIGRRTREIGIRMALGARSGDILNSVLTQGFKLILIGLAFGLAGAFAMTRLIRSRLHDVSPTDPLTFVCVSLLLAGVALLACYIPARRATKIDPMTALRYE